MVASIRLALLCILLVMACSERAPTALPLPASFRVETVGSKDGPALVFACLETSLTVFMEKGGSALGDIEVLLLQGLEPLAFQNHGNRGSLMIQISPLPDISGAFILAETTGNGALHGGNQTGMFVYDARGFKESLESLRCG